MSTLSTRGLSALTAAGLVSTGLILVSPVLVSAPEASAIGTATHPNDPAVAEQWVNSAIRPGEGEDAQVSLINGPTALAAHDPLTITLRVTNTSSEARDDLTVTPQRGPATGSVGDQRMATIAQSFEYDTVGRTIEIDKRLAPGESTEIKLTIPADELPLPPIATYPLMIVLSDSTGAQLDTDRFHLSIRGTPTEVRPAEMTTIFPVSAPVNIVAGETGAAPGQPPLILSSEELADQLAEGGRLDSLINVYADTTAEPAVAKATCLALDPALIHTVERMTHGYAVSPTRPNLAEPPKRLRDSWGSSKDDASATPGRGAAAAEAWLTKVAEATADRCTVALPWANADLNAIAETGNQWLMREALERGPAELNEVFGNRGMTNTVIPGAGYTDQGVPVALGWADHSRSTIEEEGMQGSWERTHSVTPGGQGQLPAAPEPGIAVRVLMSANSVSHPDVVDEQGQYADGAQRFSWAAPNVLAVEYQDSLAATLATVGEHPETPGFSNPSVRFDYTMDSQKARSVNASSAVHLAAQQSWAYPGQDKTSPLLINPPATWDARSAEDVMSAVRDVIGSGGVRPMTLEAYLTAPDDVKIPPTSSVGAPYTDPTVYSDAEILAVKQQVKFADDLSSLLVADPGIALSRYGFTLPLRRDQLTALSVNGRRAYTYYSEAERATRQHLADNRTTNRELRSAIALIPPGNVYTRTSPASPLLIVAENNLPLPVETSIRYSGPDNARLNVPGPLRIPANGSITIQMTADLPADSRSTNLQLFLATPQGSQISEPVDIVVRTAGFKLQGWIILSTLAVFLALLLLFAAGKRRRVKSTPDEVEQTIVQRAPEQEN